ncbi:trypsin-like serine protease [Polycladomyces sp. WAk]|uniref:Serine protease n=1 Tax=Polycladomyces zharkentensis TaxID=2807616 RepID=A0ABS2WP76_9BACL|nr:trypsin-like serine protease [Polycladomyces sp. WAk]MBN2910980.1 trypsin-like serine protease [Polycladomyces sp. WAk]
MVVLLIIFSLAILPCFQQEVSAEQPASFDMVVKDFKSGEVLRKSIDQKELRAKFEKETVKRGDARYIEGSFGTGKTKSVVERSNPKNRMDENPIGIMSVIGTDSREQITNTTSYPYRTIVYIEVSFENGSVASCSGWLYDDNTVATAGHCVYDQTNGWITSATVDPGRNGNYLPYGRAYATSAHSIAGWVNEGLEAYDFGALKLDRSIGNTTGTMGMRVEDTTFSYLGESVAVTGYPGDKHDQGYYYSMWKGLGTVKDEGGQGKMIFYDVDTANGQSGAPVYQSSSSIGAEDPEPLQVGEECAHPPFY